MSADERRREMDKQMVTVMERHQTIMENQDYVITQLGHQHDCTEALKREVAEMKAIVEQVRELLAALKGISFMAKWATIMGGGAAAVWHFARWLWIRM